MTTLTAIARSGAPPTNRDLALDSGSGPPPPVVCFPFVGGVIGGSHISALGLIRRLDQQRFTPLVVLQHMTGPVAELFRNAGIAIEPGPAAAQLELGRRVGVRELAALFADVAPIARFLRQRQVAVVHTNDGRIHASWALPARLAGAKLVWHHRSTPSAMGVRHVAPLVAHRIVTVSRFAAPQRGRAARKGKYEVIHSPFATDLVEDRDLRRTELVRELGCPPETQLIGFFGSLVSRKRPLLFVEAIAALQRLAPDLPIVGLMFGDALEGSDGTVPALAQRLGVGDQVRLMGFRHPGTRWLAACDLLMVPAVDEPFGRTLIEAMILGTPVVATACGGNVEALRDGVTGLLTPPEDPVALACAARHLLIEPEVRARLVDAARADARGRFSEAGHAAAIMQIYDEILGAAGQKH